MTNIRVHLTSFPGGYSAFPATFQRRATTAGLTDASGALQLTPADIRRVAMTYGASPLQVISATSRGQIQLLPLTFPQLTWRSHLVAANLSVTRSAIYRSTAYDRLDPSEKSAVSYFLGMTQATVIAEKALGIAYTAHLDLVMTALSIQLRRKSRPDLLGVDAAGTIAVSIEAKGRSGGFSSKVVSDAKGQAQKLPVVQGVPLALSLASLAYFDNNDAWVSHVADPPSTGASFAVPRSLVIAAHYARIIDLAYDPNARREEAQNGRVKFSTEDDIVEVEIPAPILAAFEESGYRPGNFDVLDTLSSDLAPLVERLAPKFESYSSNSTSVGLDGVLFRFRDL